MKLICLLLFAHTVLYAQPKNPWQGKSCAVALTYDDALLVHLDNVVPALDTLNLKATFYLSGYFPGFIDNVARWKRVAASGHELGNHTLFHPCAGNLPGREWVNPTYDLSTYSLQRITDEINMTNKLLLAVDGQTARTFAYPCGDTKAGDVDYFAKVQGSFVAARGVKGELQKKGAINFADVGSYSMDGQSGEEMITLVKKAREANTALVFLFHGVGGGHSLNVALAEHKKLLRYLKENESEIWVAPFIDIVKHAKGQ